MSPPTQTTARSARRTTSLSAFPIFTLLKSSSAQTVGAAPNSPKSAAAANGSSISTILTTPASNSWNSLPYKNPVARNILARIPNHDLPLLSQPLPLAPSTLLSALPSRRLLFSAARQSAKPRQASSVHRRRHHRLCLCSRRTHRLLRLSQNQNKGSRRARPRRHLAPGRQRQAPPPARRSKIHARHPALQLPDRLLPLVPQRTFHPRGAPRHHGSRRKRQDRRLFPNARAGRLRPRNSHQQRRQRHSRRR